MPLEKRRREREEQEKRVKGLVMPLELVEKKRRGGRRERSAEEARVA